LIGETIHKHDITPGTLTLHADRGSSMRSKLVAELLIDLDVAKSHSRPYVSDDNPFSESQFRTFKYRPEFPDRFGSIEDARAHCQRFFQWYNQSHRHSGIGLMTPATVHFGRDKALHLERQRALDAAFHAHPNRFKGNAPKPPQLPIAVWINPPKKEPAPSELHDPCTLNSSNLVSHSH
jgi:putative transposase